MNFSVSFVFLSPIMKIIDVSSLSTPTGRWSDELKKEYARWPSSRSTESSSIELVDSNKIPVSSMCEAGILFI